MAYMDVALAGQPNGRTVVLLHGMNFGGFYFSGPIEVLRKNGFRVVVPCPDDTHDYQLARAADGRSFDRVQNGL